MEWYYWILITIAWYVGAAFVVRKIGYAPFFRSYAGDLDKDEQTARMATWVLSPFVATFFLIVGSSAIIIFSVGWPLWQLARWVDKSVLQPKVKE